MFEGFTPEAVDFLWGIRMNNRRDWFMEHKATYTQAVYQPMKALGAELFQPFLSRPGNLLKVSRIYRDARLHHPDPYKESLWICIRKDVAWWGENPCLYFEIRPEGVSYGFALWQPKVAAMEAFRQELARDSREFFALLKKLEEKTGMTLEADCYRRPKAAPREELAPFYAWRGNLGCTKEVEPGPAMFSKDLAKEAAAFLEALYPVYEYFYRFTR